MLGIRGRLPASSRSTSTATTPSVNPLALCTALLAGKGSKQEASLAGL
ncbi:hypothetical protein [Microbulbifer halophilus]